MTHPDWCGNVCANCRQPCWLDYEMPCSPDCLVLGSETGEPNMEECKQCDAIRDISGA